MSSYPRLDLGSSMVRAVLAALALGGCAQLVTPSGASAAGPTGPNGQSAPGGAPGPAAAKGPQIIEVTTAPTVASPLEIVVPATVERGADEPRASHILHLTTTSPRLRVVSLEPGAYIRFSPYSEMEHADGPPSPMWRKNAEGPRLEPGNYGLSVLTKVETKVYIFPVDEAVTLEQALVVSPRLPATLPVAQRAFGGWLPFAENPGPATDDPAELRHQLFLKLPRALFVAPTRDLDEVSVKTRPLDKNPLPRKGEPLLVVRVGNGATAIVMTADGRRYDVVIDALGDVGATVTLPDPTKLVRTGSIAGALASLPRALRAPYGATASKLDAASTCFLDNTRNLDPNYPPHRKVREQAAQKCGVGAAEASANQLVAAKINPAVEKWQVQTFAEIAARFASGS